LLLIYCVADHNYNTKLNYTNNLYLPQANLTIYQKGAYYSGIKFFNNLPLEIRMLSVTKQNLKLLWKKCYTLIHFTQWKSTLANRELSTYHKIFIIVVYW